MILFQQQQSAANCISCSQQQLNWTGHQPSQRDWQMHPPQPMGYLNGSNMSLNLPPQAYYPQQMQQQHNFRQDGPPPAWINGWNAPNMYPYPMGMVPAQTMTPCKFNVILYISIIYVTHLCFIFEFAVPLRSRAPSRSHSRAASPSLSVKSRKSTMSGRAMNRTQNFVAQHQLTDDEDSPSDGYFDDYRSLRSERRDSSARSVASRRRNSTDDDSEHGFGRGSQRASSGSRRDRRSGSMNRSGPIERTPPAVKVSTATSTVRSHSDRVSIGSPDSESEPSGTKALVQAKILEKLAQQSSVDESSSDFWTTSPLKAKPAFVKPEVMQPKPKAPSPEPVEPEILRIISADPVQSNAELDDQGPVGPPPAAPTFEWICEFCTFVNEPNIKICTICCKTPTAVPAPVGSSNHQPNTEPSLAVPSAKPNSDSSGCNLSPDENAAPGSGASDKTKGKTRKISFLPGTKPK